jgi:Protein of unknown function (DUF2798)
MTEKFVLFVQSPQPGVTFCTRLCNNSGIFFKLYHQLYIFNQPRCTGFYQAIVTNCHCFMTVKNKFRKYIHTAFIIIPMTLLMSLTGVIRNYGFHNDWMMQYAKTWLIMFPVAYCAALIIFPFANKLTRKMKFID